MVVEVVRLETESWTFVDLAKNVGMLVNRLVGFSDSQLGLLERQHPVYSRLLRKYKNVKVGLLTRQAFAFRVSEDSSCDQQQTFTTLMT